ncbi:MAG: glycoside hydrolase family 88 protein [Clostridium sp.]|nr:glycoside hydrolase family 88 protein [Clostridium sp.]
MMWTLAATAVMFMSPQRMDAGDVVFRLKNTLGFARTHEMVSLPVPDDVPTEGRKLVDEAGNAVPYEVTADGNLRFLATVPHGATAAYTLTEGEAAPLVKLTYAARMFPSSRNDIAWENDLAAYRMYSHQLQSSEPNTANGVDLWQKKQAEPVIDKMYASSNYHSENEYGVDAYSVNGKTLGAGGVSAYAGGKLWLHDAYDECRILENGPLRSEFELVYNNVEVNGKYYTKTLRVETAAGRLLNKATVRYDGPEQDMEMAVCIYQHTNMSGVSPEGVSFTDVPGLIGWAENKSEGTVTSAGARFYLGAYMPGVETRTEVIDHHLSLTCTYTPGTELTYYFGGGWNIFPRDTYASDDDWFDALDRFRQTVDHPLTETTMQTLPHKDDVIDLIHRVNGRWQESHPTHGDFFWNRAVYHVGNMEAYAVTGDATYLDYSMAWAEQNNWCGAPGTDRTKWKYTYGEGGDYVLFGDCQVCFQIYADLYSLNPSPEKIARALEVMDYEIHTANIDYLWWVDGLFMVMPVMTRMYKLTGDELYLQKMYDYWRYATDLMYDEEESLYYRDGKYIYPAHKTNSGKKDFWARGDGWMFAAFARVLNDLPLTDPHRDEYISVYRKMAAAVAAAQQPEGYWTRSLIDPAYAPGYESSGTCLFTYGYLWGFNHGILSEKEYGATVEKAWNYLTTIALREDGSVGYMQPIGESADPDHTVAAGSVTDFGTGAFLLAACEMARYGVGDVSVPALRISSVRMPEPNQIQITFNDVPDQQEAVSASHYRLNGAPVEAGVEADGGRTVTLTFARPLDFGRYTLEVEGLTSEAGGEMNGVQSRLLVRTVPLTPCPAGITVTASGNQSGNTPAKTIDNSLSSRWSHDGIGQWIRYDLGGVKSVEAVDLAFYAGLERISYFDVQTSVDGSGFDTVLADCRTSGQTNEMERYAFPQPVEARYVRILCNGNSQGGENWNSITEARIRLTENTLETLEVPSEIYTDILLPESTKAGNPLLWCSSRPAVLSASGLVATGDEQVDVDLTAVVGQQERTYRVAVMPRTPERTLRLHYAFSESDTYMDGSVCMLTDRSGAGRDGRVMGKAVIDGTLNLTGNTATGFTTNGYVMAPQGLLDSLRSYTVMFTATPASLDKLPRFYDFGAGSAHSMFLRAGSCAAGMKYNGGATALIATAEQPVVGREQKYAVTFDAHTFVTAVYIDGQKVAEGTSIGYEPYQLARLKADSRNYIGRTQWWDNTAYRSDNQDYRGTMDNFRIYAMALTEAEMEAIYAGDATGVSSSLAAADSSYMLRRSVVHRGEVVEILCSGAGGSSAVVEVFDAVGSCVARHAFLSAPFSFTADMASGIYLVRITEAGGRGITLKLIVK